MSFRSADLSSSSKQDVKTMRLPCHFWVENRMHNAFTFACGNDDDDDIIIIVITIITRYILD